jgi:thermitase
MPPALSQHRVVTWALVLGLCLLMLSGAAGRAGADSTVGEFIPRQVIIKLATSSAIVEEINTTYGSLPGNLSRVVSDIYLLQLPPGSGVIETVDQMTADGRLLYAEPNFVADTPEGDARHRAWGVSDVAPSYQDYAASTLNLPIAQNVTRGEGVTVAVLDTGAQLEHLALAANFEGVKRYDFVGDDNNPSDRRVGADTDGDGLKDDLWGHGTHVAGIVDFVAPAAKIMPLRVLDTEGYGNVFAIAKAVSFAERNGANVVNLSLGSPNRSRLLRNEIKRVSAIGVLVAAAGNSNSSVPRYPAAGNGVAASADGLLAVTSVDMYSRKSGFANYGGWVDVAAPGEAIRSPFPVGVYAYWSGTSMATPFVSGQAALIRAHLGSSLDAAGVEGKVRCTAQSLLLTDPIYAAMLGEGQADVGASLTPGVCS